MASVPAAGLTKSKYGAVNFRPCWVRPHTTGLARFRRTASGQAFGRGRALPDRAAGGWAAPRAIIFVPGVDSGDEIVRAIEPAHRLVFGYGLVPSEFQPGDAPLDNSDHRPGLLP